MTSRFFSLGNPSKDRQRFVEAGFLISAPDWSVRLSNFEYVADTPFEIRSSNVERCQVLPNCFILQNPDIPQNFTSCIDSAYILQIPVKHHQPIHKVYGFSGN